MKFSKIIILVGIPASGKSTWARQYVKENPGWVRVSRDDFRYMLQDKGICDNKIETLISGLVKDTVIRCIGKGLNVIIDATHVKLSYVNESVDAYKEYADISFKIFDESIDTCMLRDSARERKVGEEVIRRMHKNLIELKKNYKFNVVFKEKSRKIVPIFDSLLPSAICFDIDGTLSLMGNRSPYEWAKIDLDECNQIVSEQIEFHAMMGRKIIILSGRDGGCRELTEKWLEDNGIKYDMLLMRSAGDMRKDCIVKKELYENYIKGKYNLLCVFDDRLQVLKMWYEEGIFTFNVNQGMKDF